MDPINEAYQNVISPILEAEDTIKIGTIRSELVSYLEKIKKTHKPTDTEFALAIVDSLDEISTRFAKQVKNFI